MWRDERLEKQTQLNNNTKLQQQNNTAAQQHSSTSAQQRLIKHNVRPVVFVH
jgi:hypothetical protein